MATLRRPTMPGPGTDPVGRPWLEEGTRMTQRAFHERYEKTPAGFQAELIGGVVHFMSSPLKNRHGRGDARSTGWLFNYHVETPGTVLQTNTTTILGDDSEPQPDAALRVREDCGGRSRDFDDFTHGPPELVVEIADSTQPLDLGAKRADYEPAGVQEYVVFDMKARAVRWFELRDGLFGPLAADADGLFRSRVFPGLWLDPAAFFRDDDRTVLEALRRGLASPEHAAFVAQLAARRSG